MSHLLNIATLCGAVLLLPEPVHAQADVGVTSQVDFEAPDLAALFRARPPMGDCPIGPTAGTSRVPENAHLLHLGVPRFFLNHRGRMHLTDTQIAALTTARQAALQAWQRQQEQIDRLEQRLWDATGAEHPPMADVQSVMAELGRLGAAQRMAYIRAVFEASSSLTEAQREALIGPRHPAGGAP